MVMIRCPSCGQRALDVASACPRCGHVLLQNPLETHSWADLVSCRRCGKHIARDIAECPYCGHRVRRSRRVRRSVWAAGAVLLVAVAGHAAFRGLLRGGPLDGPRAAAPAAAPSEPLPVAAPDTQPAAPVAATTPTETPPAAAGRRPSRAPGPSESLERRWTIEWANVREGRGVHTPVVQVLAPGIQVNVADMRNGWWALYEDGTVRGYIANSVLARRPPNVGA